MSVKLQVLNWINNDRIIMIIIMITIYHILLF